MSLLKIDALIGRSLNRAGIRRNVNASLALERASQALSHVFSEKALVQIRPAFVRQKTLTIACLNSSAAASVGIFEQDILLYVNEGFAQPIVERIRVIS